MPTETLDISLRLTSDGEPGSGFGTPALDQLLPRDWRGRIVIPASHFKGLLRQTLREITESLGLGPSLVTRTFGEADDSNTVKDGASCRLNFSDLVTDAEPASPVSRTRIDPARSAAATHSLRTSERIGTDSIFTGRVRIRGADRTTREALTLAIVSLQAIGASRTRGCGRCAASVVRDERHPSAVLQQLLTLLNETTR